ncbi:MAG TPA: hypothetical protein VKU00_22855 [Chthonomonadaceae bacterium]|nr:hypothetical protein [Chthonomonadaceae bacterium]
MDTPDYYKLFPKDPVGFLLEEEKAFQTFLATLTDEEDRQFAHFLHGKEGFFMKDIPAMVADPKWKQSYLGGTFYQ